MTIEMARLSIAAVQQKELRMTTHARDTLSLTDIDEVLPEAFEILQPSDSDMSSLHAGRIVRHATTGQTYNFQTPRQYLHFVLSITPSRLLTEVVHTRYIELSSHFDNDVYFHASVTYTIAAITRNLVVLHRLKSDETPVRFELSRAQMVALISGYQTYLEDCEQEEADAELARDPFLDFSDDLT
jgi:hypothetical protein